MKLPISYFILATLAKCQDPEAQNCDDNVVVLGDSYSDTGNLFLLTRGKFPPRDVYGDGNKNIGRFTNGRVWIEYLADLMNLNQPTAHVADGGTNFAIGGAASGDTPGTQWSPDLPGDPLEVPARGLILQTEDVVRQTSNQCASETLFAIWIGAVDLLILGETNVQNIVTNIETSINSLITKGAIKFIILNLPQLADSPGYGPDFPTRFLSQERPTDLRGSVTNFNTGLATMLQTINASNPGVTITHVDIAPLFAEAAANPTQFGLDEDVNTPTLNEGNNNLNEANALWFDGVHPTTTFHEAIAKEVHRVVMLPPIVITKPPIVITKNTKTGKNNKAAKNTKNVKKGSKDTK